MKQSILSLIFLFLTLGMSTTLYAGSTLDSLRREAAQKRDRDSYAAVCKYFYSNEGYADLLSLYADTLLLLAERTGDETCRIEHYLWKSEAAFQQGKTRQGFSLKRHALQLAERARDYPRLSEGCSDMGYYFNVDARYDSARHYFRRGMEVSEHRPELAAAYRTMLTNYASSFLFEGKADSALAYTHKAHRRSLADRDTAMLIENLNQLGTLYRRQKQLEKAIGYFEQALQWCVSQQNFATAAYIYGNIATTYCDWNRREDAIPFSQKAVEFAELLGNQQMMAVCYVNLGAIQSKVHGQEDASIATLQKAIPMLEKLNNRRRLCEAYSYLVNVYHVKNDLKQALHYLALLDGLAGEMKTDVERYRYYITKGRLLEETGNYAEALTCRRHQVEILENGYKDPNDYLCYQSMANCYSQSGKHESAYDALLEAYALRDSSFHREQTEQLSDFAMKYKTQEKELEILRLEREQRLREVATFRHYVLFGIVVVLLGVLLLVMLYVRQRQKARLSEAERLAGEKDRRFLELQKESERRLTHKYIDGLEAERQRIATELHDDVCNSLLALEMKVQTQLVGVDNDALHQSADQLNSIRERLRALSHELIPPTFQYATLDEMMADHLYHLPASSGLKVKYTSTPDADWRQVPEQMGFEVYRIVQEAVGNVIKHSHATQLCVELSFVSGCLTLVVADNGVGIDTSRHKEGIGLRTLRQRAQAIGGQLELTTPPGGGTRLQLSARVSDAPGG